MKFTISTIVFILILAAGLYGFEPHFITDPAISPDGNQICMVYQGDLWLVSYRGGIARRITNTEASESGPVWSPDGQLIAFNSNREGQTWVYTISSSGGSAHPVFKEGMSVCDWFSDSKNLLCSKGNLSFGTSLYQVPLSGKKPLLIAEIGDYFSQLSPDNSKIVFNRFGNAYRESYRGSTNGDLWEYDIESKTYSKLTDTDFTERYPVFSYVSNSVYFSASDATRYQLNKVSNGDFSSPEQLSDFDPWSVRDISIARTNDRMVFELFDTIWCYDPDKDLENRFYQLPIEIVEDNWSNLNIEETIIDTFDKFTVSNDELLVAFTYKYDLFVMPRKGGDVRQVTFNQQGIEDIAFLDDNRTIVFTQYTNGVISLFKTKIDVNFNIESVDWYGNGKFNIDSFYPSSDFHWVIEYTDKTGSGRVAVSNSSLTEFEPVVTDQELSSQFVCSPDGSMAVFSTLRNDIYIRELYLYDFSSKTRKKLLNEDSWIYAFNWLPDQKSILLSRSGSNKAIYRLDLIPRDDSDLEKDNWKEILTVKPKLMVEDSTSAISDIGSRKEVKLVQKTPALSFRMIDWNHIDKRLYPILSDTEYVYAIQAIDDTSFYYIKDIRSKERKTYLYTANIFGKNSNELGSFPQDPKLQIVNDKNLYYKDSNKLKVFSLKSKSRSTISSKFEYSYNLLQLNETVFEQVWGVFGRNFYDPNMHNKNWEDLFERFKPFLQYADNTYILEVIIEELIGEINASHTGFYPRNEKQPISKPMAYLGMEFDQRKLLLSGLEVSLIYPGSVLYDYYGIRDKDVLSSINGTQLNQTVPLDSLLLGMVDKKLDLIFEHDNKDIAATVKGLSWSSNRDLWFENKTEKRKQLTNKLSDNRVGYVFIPRMSSSDYTNFISDLFTQNADKEALIIDIRGNSGGRIHNDLLDFLSRRPNAFTTRRSSGAIKNYTPARTWTKPIALLIDEGSFSDAEIFPQLFKEAELGIVVGMPTSGSVIGTWQYNLMDGSSMRMPGSGWYRLNGMNMEGNGTQPDILVEMSLNDYANDNDLQLRKAVELLLDKIE